MYLQIDSPRYTSGKNTYEGQYWEKVEQSSYLLACLDQAGGDDELEDAEEDEEDAGHHPHVKLGHVGHPDERYGICWVCFAL